jgi:hypothetical protein
MLSTNLIIHRCIDLGSIKCSLNKRSGSTKSEFTCCSNSLARALVIGPILISLDFFTGTSSSKGVGDNGCVIGMSSSITELGLVPNALDPLDILCDNTSAIALAKEPRYHPKTKHINHHFHII